MRRRHFNSVEDALAANVFDCAHVPAPPPVHLDVALPVLRAAKPVLIEKPLAANGTDCAVLLTLPRVRRASIGVNQNFLYHPAFARLRNLVAARALGQPKFVGCIYNVPLRQLMARQFGHWMFAAPVNLLLEQAVHPLSQIAALAGTIHDVAVQAGPAIELALGVPFHASLDASLDVPVTRRHASFRCRPVLSILASDRGVRRRRRGRRHPGEPCVHLSRADAVDGGDRRPGIRHAHRSDDVRHELPQPGSIHGSDIAPDPPQRRILPEHASEHRRLSRLARCRNATAE